MTIQRNIGLIGVGAIGSRMARRLIDRGHSVVVYDVDPNVLSPMRNYNVQIAQSAADVGARCATIITCVTNADAVRDALIGPQGVVEGAAPGTIIIETTTSTPSTTRLVGDALSVRGIQMIDAPVSRGVPAAEAGTLSIMVGGNAETIEHSMPLLKVLGTDIVLTGNLGTGHIAKAMNMLVLGVNLVAAAEIVALGRTLGVSPTRMITAINADTSESFMTSNHFVKYILPSRFDSGFSLDLMLKDVRIATQIAHENRTPALFATRVEEIYLMAASSGLSGKDNTLIAGYVSDLMNFQNLTRSHDNEGAIIRSLSTLLMTVTLLGTIEACLIGQRAGLPPERLIAALNVSSGASFLSRNIFPKHILSDSVGWERKIDHLHGDCLICSRTAQEFGAPMILCGLALDILSVAIGRGLRNAPATRLTETLGDLMAATADQKPSVWTNRSE